MSHFDDLPRRSRNHEIEEKAEAAFKTRLLESGAFILQRADHKDYGTDCQIEVVDQNDATNVRVHVQLKGTERTANADGSISVEIDRTNLNYLLMHPHSFYACYHLPTDSLWMCFAESVLRQYDHGGRSWTGQQTLTVSFSEALTIERLKALSALARSDARSLRDRRLGQSTADPADVPGILRRSVPDVHVPENRATAVPILAHLYESGADEVISSGFDKFAAVFGADDDAMGPCYMAEINLGMAGRNQFPKRIESAVAYFRARLDVGRYQVGSLYYTIGNAFSALGDEQQAKESYEAAVVARDFMNVPALAAQTFKNLGSSLERLGDHARAAEYYNEALRLSPDLPEAHNALGNHYHRLGRYEDALAHFDRVVFTENEFGKTAAVAGWRVNTLFNLGDGRAAFREINTLLSRADDEAWIWSWCARHVASFGRATAGNAVQALPFWQRYVSAHANVSAARRELLLTIFYLRGERKDIGKSYAEFLEEFELHIAHVDAEDTALPWDRLGHWAQEESDWPEAERCFRKAYELEGGHYGYCLGTALNFLHRFEESLPILREQAEVIQADAMSWFQVAIACGGLGRDAEAIEAYRKALKLDPNYDLAMFNLGGIHWNSGDLPEAARIWRLAAGQFPQHELAAKLRREMPFLFGN
jgi:tetratricopeptide (TPR) repeat protein